MNEEEKNNSSPEAPPQKAAGPHKKRRGRRAYLSDIRMAADGRYHYTGDCYEYDAKYNPRTAVLLRLWLTAAPAILACVISGCLSAPFMRDTWYVIAPFGFELASLGSAVWAIGRITGNGSVMRSYVRKQTFGALPRRCWFAVCFAAAGLIGAAVYLILHGTAVTTASGNEDQTLVCILYLVCKAVNIVCCILIVLYVRSVFWKESAKKI